MGSPRPVCGTTDQRLPAADRKSQLPKPKSQGTLTNWKSALQLSALFLESHNHRPRESGPAALLLEVVGLWAEIETLSVKKRTSLTRVSCT